jgi:hypothetical protein
MGLSKVAACLWFRAMEWQSVLECWHRPCDQQYPHLPCSVIVSVLWVVTGGLAGCATLLLAALANSAPCMVSSSWFTWARVKKISHLATVLSSSSKLFHSRILTGNTPLSRKILTRMRMYRVSEIGSPPSVAISLQSVPWLNTSLMGVSGFHGLQMSMGG